MIIRTGRSYPRCTESWEPISVPNSRGNTLERLDIGHGWIFKQTFRLPNGDKDGVTICFVPKPPEERPDMERE